jgi:hypothetical protein
MQHCCEDVLRNPKNIMAAILGYGQMTMIDE